MTPDPLERSLEMLDQGEAYVNKPGCSLHKAHVRILQAGEAERSGNNLVSRITHGSQG
jgi:hypothetical protein